MVVVEIISKKKINWRSNFYTDWFYLGNLQSFTKNQYGIWTLFDQIQFSGLFFLVLLATLVDLVQKVIGWYMDICNSKIFLRLQKKQKHMFLEHILRRLFLKHWAFFIYISLILVYNDWLKCSALSCFCFSTITLHYVLLEINIAFP